MEGGIIALIVIGVAVLFCLIGLLFVRLRSKKSANISVRGDNEEAVVEIEASLPPVCVIEHDPECDDGERSPTVYSCVSFSDVQHAMDSFVTTAHQNTTDSIDGDSYAYPKCRSRPLKDWGPGLATCSECSARPVLNRGCGECDKRMCQRCFDAHISLKVSVLELAKQTVLKYGSLGGKLAYNDWVSVLRDLKLPIQSEHGFNNSTQDEGISIEDLARLLTYFPKETTTALSRIIKPSAACGTPEVSKLHDWGPGLSSCSVCNSKPILNRGCRACMKKMCQKCFNQHVNLSQLYIPQSDPVPATPATVSIEAQFAWNAKCPPKVVPEFNVLTPKNIELLQSGGSLYFFSFQKGKLPDLQRIDKIINLTSFEDEMRDNCVPTIDPISDTSCVYLLNKAVYLLQKGVSTKMISDQIIASSEYQKTCQPSGTKVLVADTPDTFRIAKTIIWPVYSLTIQFKVSIIPPEMYPELEPLNDNLPIHLAVLLERTKRNKKSTDMIKKAKSILLYHNLEDGDAGVVVTNITAGAATSVPSIIAGVVDKLGSMGAKDVAETAINTRKYFHKQTS